MCQYFFCVCGNVWVALVRVDSFREDEDNSAEVGASKGTLGHGSIWRNMFL